MKIPVHTIDLNPYCKGGEDDIGLHHHPEVVEHLINIHHIKRGDILLLDWNSSEVCIYIKGKWSGYLSDLDIY